LKPRTETDNPDLSHTAMLGVLDSVESLLNDKEREQIEAAKSAKAEQHSTPDDAPRLGKTKDRRAASAEIPVLHDVVSMGTIELQSRAAPRRDEAGGGQTNSDSAAVDSPSYLSDMLQQEVDRLVSDVMAEYSEKLLEELREKLKQRVTQLLIQARKKRSPS